MNANDTTPGETVQKGDKYVNPATGERFTILRFLDGKALLPACAVELTNRFYPA